MANSQQEVLKTATEKENELNETIAHINLGHESMEKNKRQFSIMEKPWKLQKNEAIKKLK